MKNSFGSFGYNISEDDGLSYGFYPTFSVP